MIGIQLIQYTGWTKFWDLEKIMDALENEPLAVLRDLWWSAEWKVSGLVTRDFSVGKLGVQISTTPVELVKL